MKIAVVGSGAIGGLFGSILTKNGQDPLLVDIWTEHVEAMKERGLTIVGPNGEEDVIKVRTSVHIEEAGTPDLILMSVKSYDTEQAARDCLRIIGPDTIVMTVQNGVGNVDKIGEVLGYEHVIAGTTTFGSTILGPARIKPSGIGEITLGELNGEMTPRLQNLVDSLTKSGFVMHTSNSIDSLIWTKLVVNVGINALTAITMLLNGELLDHPETVLLQDLAVLESQAVAKAKGIKFNVDDIVKHVKDVSRSTGSNKSSMRQDIERGKRTEIEYINGAIVTEGKKLGIPIPVNEVLTLLVKTIEKRGNK